MNAESQSGMHMPEFQHMRTFPLSEKAVGDSVAWLMHATTRLPELFDIEKINLNTLDPTLYSYLTQMHELRSEVQFTKDDAFHYMNGAIFGVNVLSNQFEQVGLNLPKANKSALATYFKSLIKNNNNLKNTDMQYDILIATQPGIIKEPMTPRRLTERIKANLSDPLLYEIKKRFRSNSINVLGRMWNSEPELASATHAIRNVVEEGKRGFFFGIVDVYAPIKMDHVVGPYVEILDKLKF